MVPGETELANAAERFASLMTAAARNPGGIRHAGAKALLADIDALRRASEALVESDFPEPAEVRRVTELYQQLYIRVFEAMKVPETKAGRNVV